MKFKKIIGGTEEDVYKRFSWLESAVLENAEVDITNSCLIWKGGKWKGGTWKGGTWEGGTWEGGWMWNNRLQKYEDIKQVDEKFEVAN